MFLLLILQLVFGFKAQAASCGEMHTEKRLFETVDQLKDSAPLHGIPFPNFAKIQVEHFIGETRFVERLVDKTLQQVENAQHASIDSVIAPLDLALGRINVLREMHEIYSSSLSNPRAEEQSASLIDRRVQAESKLLSNDAVFAQVDALYQQRENLSRDDRKAVEFFRETMLANGAGLTPQVKVRLAEIRTRIMNLGTDYPRNIQTHIAENPIDVKSEKALLGIPNDVVNVWRDRAQKAGVEGFRITLKPVEVEAVLVNAQNPELRERVWRANREVAMIGKSNNQAIVEEIATLRAELAALLHPGKTYAEMASETKGIGSLKAIEKFMNEVERGYRELEKFEENEIKEFAGYIGSAEIPPWDKPYWSRKLRDEKIQMSTNQLREYFPLEVVRGQLFKTVETLFDVKISAREDLPVPEGGWSVFEFKDHTGKSLGFYIMDLYGRPGKANGAWMSQLLPSHVLKGERVPANVINQANFIKPVEGPTLLTLDQVRTIYHEMGHALHAILSQSKYLSSSGTNVQHDMVELPSKFMEHFALTPDFYSSARHYKTGEPLTPEMINRLLASAKFGVGKTKMNMVRRHRLDIAWHDGTMLGLKGSLLEREIAVMFGGENKNPETLSPASPTFHHLFSAGTDHYAAGFSSYVISEALAAQAASLIIRRDGLDLAAARRFQQKFLEPGRAFDWEAFTQGIPFSPQAMMKKDGALLE